MTDKLKFVLRDASKGPLIVTWPCTIQVPTDGGSYQAQSIDVKFKVLSFEAAEDARKKGTLYQEAVLGFPGFQNEAGDIVPDDQAIAALAAIPYAVTGIVSSYLGLLHGLPAKN